MNAHFPFQDVYEQPAPHPTIREAIETAIEALIALLDVVEGEPDIENNPDSDSDREPTAGSYGETDEMECDDADIEPALGSLGSTWPSYQIPDQVHWAGGAGDDREDSQDEEEPSLGWSASIRQVGFNWSGACDDAEAEHDGREPLSHSDDREMETDSCIADAEGANEQGFLSTRHWFDHVE